MPNDKIFKNNIAKNDDIEILKSKLNSLNDELEYLKNEFSVFQVLEKSEKQYYFSDFSFLLDIIKNALGEIIILRMSNDYQQ